MAFDLDLADEIRAEIGDRSRVIEREMFGGIAFMINGNMAVGVIGNELMVRVGKDAHDEAISLPGARIFDMTKRPMRGWIMVAPEGLEQRADFRAWVARGIAFAESLPAK